MSRPEVAVGAVCTHRRARCCSSGGGGERRRASGRCPAAGSSGARPCTRRSCARCYEETGLEVVVDRYLGWVERIHDPYHYVILDFAVTVLDPTQPPVAGDDAAEVAWVPFADVSDLDLVAGLYEFLRDVEVW